jgi:hypothetical protein
VPRDALARYPENMAGDERPTLEELSQLSPNERAELARAGVVREWEQLDPSEQAHIQAKTAELRRRRADAQT